MDGLGLQSSGANMMIHQFFRVVLIFVAAGMLAAFGWWVYRLTMLPREFEAFRRERAERAEKRKNDDL